MRMLNMGGSLRFSHFALVTNLEDERMSRKNGPYIIPTERMTIHCTIEPSIKDPGRKMSRRERRIKAFATGIAFFMLGTLLVGLMLVIFAAVGI